MHAVFPHGSGLVRSALALAIRSSTRYKHRAKSVDRLLGNSAIAVARPQLYAAVATCWLMGVNPCVDEIKRQLGVERREVTADGKFSWDTTECLGSCGTAPAMQIGDRYYENLTPARVAEVIEKLRKD